ncbi:MAG: helix-turn-helix domain-containing protein [Azoarcus sp.]|nr:helix-turn-helix domain-containing protein [Azoarcus sp.]
MNPCQNSPLKNARLRHGQTLQSVAAAVGTDTGNLSRIERGRQVPSKDLAERLSQHFGGEVTETEIIWPERFADPVEATVPEPGG